MCGKQIANKKKELNKTLNCDAKLSYAKLFCDLDFTFQMSESPFVTTFSLDS